MKHLLIIFLVLVNTGCASSPAKYKSDTDLEDGFPIHGNFCGKNIPTIADKNMLKRLNALEQIDAFDDIDKLCKTHDICYAKNGYYNKQCDKELTTKALELSSKMKDSGCAQLASIIGGYFHGSNMTFTQETWSDEKSDIVTKTILTPLSVLGDAMMLTATGLMLVVNTTSTAVVDVFSATSPFPVTRDKRIQHPIPPRYKACNK